MSDNISNDEYRKIEELISSDQSPVGIDAKKTHVLILHKLARIEQRLSALEALVESQSAELKPPSEEV